MHRAGVGDGSALGKGGKVSEGLIPAGIREFLVPGIPGEWIRTQSQSTTSGKGTQIRAALTAALFFFWPSVCGKSIRNLPFTVIFLLHLWALSELCPLSRTCLGGIRSRESWKLGKLQWQKVNLLLLFKG